MNVEDLDFAKLRAFQVVASNGTLGAAATRLKLTVPAISAKLRRLEDLAGAKLFTRLPNRLALTPAGERFLAEVSPLIEAAERAVSKLNLQTQQTGSVSISVGSDYAWYFVPKLDAFLSNHPNVQLTMRIYRSSEATLALQKGQLDLCLGVFSKIPKGIETRTAVSSTLSLIFKSDKHGVPTDLSRMMRGRLIVAPRGTPTRNLIQRSLGLLPSQPSAYFECPTCQTAAALVSVGAGPAVIHSICLEQVSGQKLNSIDLGPRFGALPFVVLFRRATLTSPLLRALVNQLST